MNNVMEDFLNAELMKGIEGFDPFVENMEDFLDEENFNVEDMCVDNEAEGGEKVQDFLDEETVNLEDMCFDNEAEDGENLEDFFDEENMISDVHVDMDDFDISIETDEHVLVRDNTMTTNVDVEDEADDIEVIDNEEWDSFGDESDNDSKRKRIMKNLGKDKTCSEGHVHKPSFHVGQQYKSKKELKDRIDTHALETRRNLTFSKNDKFRLTAFCAGNLPDVNGDRAGGSSKVKKVKSKVKVKEVNEVGKGKCCWKLHASRATEDDDWVVKTYNHNHICLQSRDIKLCTATFISKQIMDQVESNPEIPVRALQDQLQKKYEVALSIDKVFRAKAAATKIVVGDYTKQYAILRDYILELQATNPETTARVDVYSEPNPSSPTRQFKRIYVCLGALKKGFKAGMRDFLGLDGTFMKGPFPGQVLTAVGVDSNNGIYPLAYAIVEAENTSSWKWFLDCLGEDLDLHANSNFTFISDRQKGLLPAISQKFPCAEHRFCLKHIYENMRKYWKTREYKDHLWKCATATTIPEFERFMREFSFFDMKAHEWLSKIPAKHWARSHFTGRAVSDMLLNNVCEVFNSKLRNGRDKPIITSLEFIREYLMKRICNVMKVMNKCNGPLTPTATKILDTNIKNASQYTARWNGLHKYQVQGPWHDQHVVDMGQMSCSCRKWELTGIPCRHAIATINEMADNGETVKEMYTYVHKVYWLETWKTAYSFKVDPIKGRSMWPRSECPTVLTPPPHHKVVGRPKKKRKQSEDERKFTQSQKGSQNQSQSQKLTRKFVTVTCGKCKHKGHNSRTCKGQGRVEGTSQGRV
ncbi:hypothetical protein L2E82_05734 [Cichorium intybus]|uniref:Uncharacterized protein n=1 Tax=Cichorium intybus TaxID=13427 RepID=A0ACB9H9M5_CICIN|nr:hypothetical protein L2E82_05734 [Cichorium intybus]